MQQYFSVKAQHPDAILLFRVGDFYETYGEDALEAAGILGIALTRKGNGPGNYIEMAGFPYHAVNTYLPKLVRAGRRVAVCEQLEDPKTVKGLVKRGVVELVTPGVVMNENVLSARENIFLAAIHFDEKKNGIAKPINGIAKALISTAKPKNDIIHAVSVVPILAPMMTPMACVSVSKPALTKLTTITVVAEEDCITEVMPRPVSTPLKGLEVMAERKLRMRSPAAFCRPELIRFIP